MRYGIAEWYGQEILQFTPTRRQELARAALGETPPPDCPFRAMRCNKAGGVCSIRLYDERNGRTVAATGDPVIVCPARFEQDAMVMSWLAEIVGFDPESTSVAREVPFMKSTSTGKHAGKIDMVVVRSEPWSWYGLEIQAVYFSGDKMDLEFEVLKDDVRADPPYPVGNRRPDWRSSGAKRLMPQLQVKGPTLRRWGSKIAVAVDRPFFDAIGGPSEHPVRDLDDGDVIWLVPELNGNQLVRGHWEVLTLEMSETKLRAAETIRRSDFEHLLRNKLKPLHGGVE